MEDDLGEALPFENESIGESLLEERQRLVTEVAPPSERQVQVRVSRRREQEETSEAMCARVSEQT